MIYYLDANIISYVLKNVPSVVNRLEEIISTENEIRIPIVSYYEVKRWLVQNKSIKKLQIFEKQVEIFGLENMTKNTYDIAANIYSSLALSGKLIEDSDIFIGAIALENEGILLTNNERHLGRIDGLKYEVIN